jgi:hypothetical protein
MHDTRERVTQIFVSSRLRDCRIEDVVFMIIMGVREN